MSAHGMEELRRDDQRLAVLLRAHLDAAEFKSLAWALADSLTWAVSPRVLNADEKPEDMDRAEFELARHRLTRAREVLK
jgi:hypothetical protein